jgi:hypothetical protein
MIQASNSFHWNFRNAHAEQTEDFIALVRSLAPEFFAELSAAREPELGLILRADFPSEGQGREFWLELHTRCLDVNIPMELAADEVAATLDWQPLDRVLAEEAAPGEPVIVVPSDPGKAESEVHSVSDALARYRAEVPIESLYDILRSDDSEMDGKLDDTIRRIERSGMPVINLLSYLDLPLFTEYAEEHPDERDQNLFLHMLHTWTCYRRYGALCARLTPELAEVLEDKRYLRLNTTMFQSPAPALCIQYPAWKYPVRGRTAADTRWVKEVYLTHFEPPTPAEDRELTLMIITHDEQGEFGFIPLELPLTLPAVDESIDAFFAPSIEDEELGVNTQDLHRLTIVAATYCLYATARDPRKYLTGAGPVD